MIYEKWWILQPSLEAVLEEPDFGPCAVLGYLHAVHVSWRGTSLV